MPKLPYLLIMICCAAILIAGCTQPTAPVTPAATATPTAMPTPSPTAVPGMPVYNESENGITEAMALGSSFKVMLDENPTTGYSWNVSVTSGLNITDDTFIPPTSGLMGAGGVHSWTVLTTKTGLQEFSGTYMRPWENKTGNETTYLLKVNVTG
ncbi:MAG: protease inhibitor I42 family protein [Methanoregulaceae archaeon]|nr:protease inhibitor I42 family protein [Methanoregulaceae archaeon]